MATEHLWAVSMEGMSLRHSSPFHFHSLALSVCLAHPPASATAAPPHNTHTCQPAPTLQQYVIDRSNYVFYWPVAWEVQRHFIVSRAKGDGYCSLSGKDDGHSWHKQMMQRITSKN